MYKVGNENPWKSEELGEGLDDMLTIDDLGLPPCKQSRAFIPPNSYILASRFGK
jgi:hypothetical protein